MIQVISSYNVLVKASINNRPTIYVLFYYNVVSY